MRGRPVVAALVLALVLGPAAPAHAAILAPEDANELAQSLAEATAEQNVCYGWALNVSDPTGAEDGPDVGSSLGPGRDIDPSRPECARYVRLTGSIVYTSEWEEAEDSAEWGIESNLERPPTVAELDRLGWSSDDLLGETNDLELMNAVGALPQLTAEHGEAEPVPFEPERRAAGVGGEPTGDQGSDFLRQNGSLLALSVLALLGGLGLLIWHQTHRTRTR